MVCCILLDLYACSWPVIFFRSPSQQSISLLSRSNWDPASHCCCNFLFGHGFLRCLLEMMRISPDWKRLHGHWGWTPSCGYVLIHVVGHLGLHDWWNSIDSVDPCERLGQCCPPLVTGYSISSLNIVCALQTWRASWIYLTPVGIFLQSNTVGCVHQHPIDIYIEGCRRSKGSVCIIPCTCIQPKISLAVYILKRI